MAFSATTVWENEVGGADGSSGNGGGFDPANANMATDLASAGGFGSTSLTVTSASYTFLARDVGHWLFIQSGSSWYSGWYKITSVNAGAATANNTAGSAVDLTTLRPNAGNTTPGPLSGGVWSIDYSQTTAAGITYTDMVIDGTTNTKYTSTLKPVGPNVVGNIIAVSSGSGFTVQRVQINSVSGTTATCDKSLGTLSSTGGNGILGGALASPGQAGALMIAGNDLYVKSGTYSIDSASSNVAGGCVTLPASASRLNCSKMIGYGTVRGDYSTKPLLQATSTIATFTIITAGSGDYISNLSLDGSSYTSARGISTGANQALVRKVKAVNFTNGAFAGNANVGQFILCEASGCSTVAAFTCDAYYCVAHDNTFTGFVSAAHRVAYCIAANNTGGSSIGFSFTGTPGTVINCLAYKNGSSGFISSAALNRPLIFVNCLAVSNVAGGFDDTGVEDLTYLCNCGVFGNTPDIGTTITTDREFSVTTLANDPFTNGAGNDFSLSTSAGGSAMRAAALPGASTTADQYPGLSSLNYADIGPLQSFGTYFVGPQKLEVTIVDR